jgi:hypothetical protein
VTTHLNAESRERLKSGICNQDRVTGLTHNFYRYPARFSPEFVRTVIQEFTQEGDLVFDPFMGGGTTLVEAMAMGRNALGTDVSTLATFIAQVKTTVFSGRALSSVAQWVDKLLSRLKIAPSVPSSPDSVREQYQRNITDRETWRIKKLLEVALIEVTELKSSKEQRLARCILLKTGQWALDCRSTIPSTSEFQKQIAVYAAEILEGAATFSAKVHTFRRAPWGKCVHRSVIGAEKDRELHRAGSPDLILTSPPYPGLHVLYHRWQVKGRRETPAPFWIAGTSDGDGASFYTLGDRKQKDLRGYFENLRSSFTSIARVAGKTTMIVQMVAFSDPVRQLPRYLDAMVAAGLEEAYIQADAEALEWRMWRDVPGRKWYASKLGATGGSREVVLFHRRSY